MPKVPARSSIRPALTRRTLLGALVPLVPLVLAGCSEPVSGPTSGSDRATAGPTNRPTGQPPELPPDRPTDQPTDRPTGTSTDRPGGGDPTPAATEVVDGLGDLERTFDARLGVWAVDVDRRLEVAHRPDERFAFCSTVKAFLAAGVLSRRGLAGIDERVRYRPQDLIANSPITRDRVATGMTLRELCDAAVRYSDNTAANLLFRDLGGPPGAQRFVRSLGDDTSDLSRTEPELNSAVPGDVRDTTTPRAWGRALQALLLGSALPTGERDLLTDWMVRNTTGAGLIRAAVPEGWRVADKTGSGSYGTRNDIAVLWPPGRGPVVLAVMTTRPDRAASSRDNDPLVAEAARRTLTALRT